MQAVLFDVPGEAQKLYLGDAPSPPLLPGCVRIAVQATALNRADLLQRRGLYPAPAGASQILGLECSGDIVEVSPDVLHLHPGQRVMALLAGGGYASEVVAHGGSVLPMPECFSYEEAAAFPETYLTAFLNIFMLGQVQAGDAVLIHGGASGVGTAAIRLCKCAGAITWTTAASDIRCSRCVSHGAHHAINYKTQSFAAVLQAAHASIQVILDCVGGTYLQDHLSILATDGRLIFIAAMGGTTATLDLATVLRKRLQLIGSTLRGRSDEFKANVVTTLLRRFGNALRCGDLRPAIDAVYPLAQAATAHTRMEAGGHFGKIVLRVPAI